MTTFEGKTIKKRDITVAKNYLYEDEIKILNRIVTAYLEFAELQAIRHVPMYMSDWIKKLDDFIKLSGSDLLENTGKVSHLEATTKAMLEFEKYKEKTKDDLSVIELNFIENMKSVQKKIEKDGGR
ncbi:RhuM family protein [Clostridium sp.]|uniref:RhuM family protein n=1 Tax=Clostridium sp. TaxID=1506 RepID=UPI003D6D8623